MNIEELQVRVTRLELKNQALLERVSNITSTYENQDADRRVDITLLNQEKQQLAQQLQASSAERDELQRQFDEASARVAELEKAATKPKAVAKKTAPAKKVAIK